VEISKSGSSIATVSPMALSHLVIVPSKIDSPIWGMMISVDMHPSVRRTQQFLPDYKSRVGQKVSLAGESL
jgi:hypothetical protein